jgi:hypothetical protein
MYIYIYMSQISKRGITQSSSMKCIGNLCTYTCIHKYDYIYIQKCVYIRYVCIYIYMSQMFKRGIMQSSSMKCIGNLCTYTCIHKYDCIYIQQYVYIRYVCIYIYMSQMFKRGITQSSLMKYTGDCTFIGNLCTFIYMYIYVYIHKNLHRKRIEKKKIPSSPFPLYFCRLRGPFCYKDAILSVYRTSYDIIDNSLTPLYCSPFLLSTYPPKPPFPFI